MTLAGYRSTWQFLCGAAALLMLLCPRAAPADPAADCPSPLTDPRAYLTIEWLQRGNLVAPGEPSWELVGDRGQVEIRLAAELMKRCWEFETEGGLAIRASRKAAATGAENQVEVPGFAEVGEPLTVLELDLSAAFDVVAQLSQGIRLANDAVLTPQRKSGVAALKGEAAALAAALAAERKVMEEVERALREVYTEALRFQLDDRHLREAAKAINEARTARAAVISPAAAAQKARLDTFFAGFEAERGSLEVWLEHLLSPANRPYLGIIARVTGRGETLIHDVASEVKALLVKLGEGKLDSAGRAAAMARLIAVAGKLTEMELAIAKRYQYASDELVGWIQDSPQYQKRAPKVDGSPWPLRDTRSAAELIRGCMEGLSSIRLVQKASGGDAEFTFAVEPVSVEGDSGGAPPEKPVVPTVGGEGSVLWSGLKQGIYSITAKPAEGWESTGGSCSDGSLPSHLVLGRGEMVTCTFSSQNTAAEPKNEAGERAQARFEVLEALLKDLIGTQQYQTKTRAIKVRFEAQIEPVLAAIARLDAAAADKRAEARQAEEQLEILGKAFHRCEATLTTQSQALQVALMKQVQDTLIDRIRPVTLSLDELGLQRGDRLSIDVSLLPAATLGGKPPKQLNSSFLVAPRGWSAVRPTITADVLTFVRADGGDDFQPRWGVSALWNYYGRSTARKSPWRAVAPGFGIGVQLLDFKAEEDPVEVGIGVTLTLFDNLLQVTWGRNISQELDLGNGQKSRDFWGIGLSINELVQKVPKPEAE